MAWEQRCGQMYYYSSVREGEAVRKVYLGRGPVARWADLDGRVRRAERREERAGAEAAAEAATRLRALALLLMEAALLASGFRRHRRGPWRAWREGLKALAAAGAARQPVRVADAGGVRSAG
jgi:hypothetical protein